MTPRPVTGTARPRISDTGLDRLKAVLGGWRSSLLDMGGRNRLLNFRHTRTATLEIGSPDAAVLLQGLARGWDFAPIEEGEDDGDDRSGATAQKTLSLGGSRRTIRSDGLITQKTRQTALDGALRLLRNKSAQMFNDYGLWVLWLGVGMLDWREASAQETSSAPLLLVPVELRHDGRTGQARLYPAEGQEPVHNPALEVKCDRLGIDWSPVTSKDVAELGPVLTAARHIAAGQDGWSVDERVVLGLFSSYKEAMYQDLQQNEDRILAHPLVRAVGLGPDSELPPDALEFEPPELDRIDEIQLPERTPLVLNADASQRQCVAAALDGRSFVMNGPPGTGKSQTITNMIAALMHDGRTVLFVSEKAAALDVVRNRLREVGLGDFALSLHSGDTAKKAVAVELARVLTTEARVTGAAEHELERARRLREELSRYAAAMNQVREPLGRTLHDILGRVVLLEQDDTPRLPLSAAHREAIGALSAGALQDATAAAQAVSRAWRPAVEAEAFVWRGLVGSSAMTAASEAAEALTALRMAGERRPFAAAIDEPRIAHDFVRTVELLRAGLPDRDPALPTALPEEVSGTLAQLADRLGAREPVTPEDAFTLFALTDLASAAERPPRAWFGTETRREAHAAAEELRRALAVLAEARGGADDVFEEEILTTAELPELVRRFAGQHRGITGRFSAQYKADRAIVAALTRDGVWHKRLIGRLDHALAWQRAATEVARLADRHGGLLGRYTPRTEADLPALDRALATADRIAGLSGGIEHQDKIASYLADGGATPDPLPGLLAGSARDSLTKWCDAVTHRIARWSDAVTTLLGLFDDARRAHLSPALLGNFEHAQQVLDDLLEDAQGPEEWQAYRDGLDVLARHHVDELVARAVERGIPAERLSDVVEHALLKAWVDRLLDTDERLRTTRSADLDARVADFQEADRRLVEAAGGAVIEACNRRRPRNFGSGAGKVIIRQAELRRRHMPVRELLGRTREVVRTIKPCFMMSPLTVSQFLPSDYHFDVVIFDEASQVRPADAINCIYRGDSLVVAGDEKQLPPTSFFDAAVEDDGDEYDEDVPDSFESLLDACKAGALNVLPLRWHYRSRHEDLITFSNREFYQNSMVTFPGALDAGNDVGLDFFPVGGTYDRGGRRDNRIEAEAVARRVIHHFDTRSGRSLGVVALSQAQASAIELAVQQALLARPDLDHCFTKDRLHGFFVKNLESVQGDERDVMIMSIGYGPDEHGKLALNFGPINKDGGWRRLNVAVTRARHRMEVVASFHGGSLGDSQNKSVQHLKRYLQYAENGPDVLAQDVVQAADAEPESPFEESVLRVLRGWGYEVQPQVGVAGFRIDLGLRHPDAPGTYALGIECDGAMYHSSKVARDRDRLREEVLRGLGWKLHRIWGTDWYRGRAAAEERLRKAVERAVAMDPLTASADEPPPPAQTQSTVPAQQKPSPDPGPTAVDHERVPVDTEPDRPWCAPYAAHQVYVTPSAELHTPEARPALRRILTQVIEAEGPIHEELLVQRAREAWGVARAGSRIRENIRQVVRGLGRTGNVSVDGDFLDTADRQDLKARHPAHGTAPRQAVHIAPAERRLALRELATECPGMSREELLRQACDFFGWRRLGQDIRAALEADVAELYEKGVFVGTEGRITVSR
ncbi:DUF3320 domain-containing protein [Streptomyces sp. 4503]|uniref:DUF3320 domain-containing protein n=1 Tax=Streptomyces niphimycinicus TaxID=2842201 RepID=A0ABS6C7L4_9ACTN|nr:DUF3320 domain-containing protein [Streptomyces niphimycinicus]